MCSIYMTKLQFPHQRWTWPPSILNGYGGWGSEMVIDANDDIFIPNVAPRVIKGTAMTTNTKVMGSGQGLTARPIYDISPMHLTVSQ